MSDHEIHIDCRFRTGSFDCSPLQSTLVPMTVGRSRWLHDHDARYISSLHTRTQLFVRSLILFLRQSSIAVPCIVVSIDLTSLTGLDGLQRLPDLFPNFPLLSLHDCVPSTVKPSNVKFTQPAVREPLFVLSLCLRSIGGNELRVLEGLSFSAETVPYPVEYSEEVGCFGKIRCFASFVWILRRVDVGRVGQALEGSTSSQKE